MNAVLLYFRAQITRFFKKIKIVLEKEHRTVAQREVVCPFLSLFTNCVKHNSFGYEEQKS